MRRGLWVVVTTAVLAAMLFVARGGSSAHTAAPGATAPGTTRAATTSTAPVLPDVDPTAADFVNIHTMARVGDHFYGSLNGHLAAALAIAHSPNGGVYPVGTVIQLFPFEAMVKRRKGYSPATDDWEFFSLSVSARGTTIKKSGPHVTNFLGADCAACHGAADPTFDMVCGQNHGCPPLGLTDAMIALIQRTDPRLKQ